MKYRQSWFVAGLSFALLSFALARRYLKGRAEVSAWQKQRHLSLDVLACPACHGTLVAAAFADGDGYRCPICQKDYPVVGGIAHFIQQDELTGLNQRFADMYDWFSWIYRAFSLLAFAYIGESEEQARREVTDRLEPAGGRVLEVSVGPGVNLPYLIGRADVGEIYGLDISLGQLRQCRAYAAHRGWDIQLQLGNAEQLPYADNTFDSVFHLGGINFFNDKKKAIEEMIRVAKPGARILISDENEKGARAYERFIPSFKQAAGEHRQPILPPVDLLPPEMQEVRVYDVWKGWLYCLEFRKPS